MADLWLHELPQIIWTRRQEKIKYGDSNSEAFLTQHKHTLEENQENQKPNEAVEHVDETV